MALKKNTKALINFSARKRLNLTVKNTPSRKNLAENIKGMKARYGSKRTRNKLVFGKGYREASLGTRHY